MFFNKLALSAVAAFCVRSAAAEDTIVELAQATDDFSTLVAAVTAAAAGPAGPNIAEALGAEGTYTVFAPTNAAFAALPEELVSKLLNATWQPQLQDVLLYHALGSEVRSTDLSEGLTAETLNGEDITVSLDPPRINDANIITDGLVDVEASNGVVHGIDAVLTPDSVTMDIVDIGSANQDFSLLVQAVTAAGLVDALKGPGPLTLFAPTNDAINALGEETVMGLLADPDTLKGILLHHVVAGNVHSGTVESGSVDSLNGTPLEVVVSDDGVTVGGAKVIDADVIASNGIIHVVDKVILPPEDGAAAPAGCYSGPMGDPAHTCLCDDTICDKEKCEGKDMTWTDRCAAAGVDKPCDCATAPAAKATSEDAKATSADAKATSADAKATSADAGADAKGTSADAGADVKATSADEKEEEKTEAGAEAPESGASALVRNAAVAAAAALALLI